METETDSVASSFAEEDSDWTGTYTWRVENWSQLTVQKIYSPEFEIGGYSWRLIVYPKGNTLQGYDAPVTAYLEYTEASFTPSDMCPTAKFQLIVVRSTCRKESLTRETTHTFTADASDWGCTYCLRIQRLQDPRNGFLVNDTFTLRLNLHLNINDILGMTSKSKTGFVGIEGTEKTSLLSCCFQSLFHIKAFRKAVFQAPTLESDDPQKELPLALQHLFYNLQYENTSASAWDVLAALNWRFNDVRLENDVLDIQRTLFGQLGEEHKACNVKDCISELFKGEYSKCTKSPSIQETQTCKESFMEIPLDILDCKDIYYSLEKFCQVGRSEEDIHDHKTNLEINKSKHNVRFDSFPTVLQFHLKRVYYNRDRNAFLKINARYEFYDELDLDYNDGILLSKNANRMIENKYKLHSVLVHAGGLDEGCFSAFIRSGREWCKLDEEVVKVVSVEEAINAQFGDETGTTSANFSEEFTNINKSAAVMLVYIRKSEWEMAMCEAGKQHLPEQIKDKLEEEQMEKEKHQGTKDGHFYVNIELATEFHFSEQIGKTYYFDLADFDNVKNYRIYKKTSFEDFKEMVSNDFGIPKHLQRFWLWNPPTNNTMRICEPLIEKEHDLKTVFDLRYLRDDSLPLCQEKPALMTIRLFLESPEQASITRGTLHPIQRNELLMFLKYYDPESSKLSYLGHMFIEKTCTLLVIFDKAKQMAGLASEEDVVGFKEVKHSPEVVCANLVPDTTPEKAHLFQGDIIIIQRVSTNHHCEFQNVKSFLEFIHNSKTMAFKRLKKPEEKGLEVELLKTMTYDQVTTELAKHLQVDDPKKLRLTQHDIDTDEPQERPVRYNGMGTLDQMILHRRGYNNVLYYEVLDMQLPYLETLNCLTIAFHNSKGTLQSEHHLRLRRNTKVSDSVNALKAELGEEYNNCDMRVMQMHSSKVFKVLESEYLLDQLYEGDWLYRAEVIPKDQKNLHLDEYLVLFCHCELKDNVMTVFGDPLWVKIKKGETVGDVRVKVQKTLEMSYMEFIQLSIAYHACPTQPVEYLKNEDEILAKFSWITMSGRTNGKFVGDDTSFIALVHEAKGLRCPSSCNHYDGYYI